MTFGPWSLSTEICIRDRRRALAVTGIGGGLQIAPGLDVLVAPDGFEPPTKGL
jgi:hypothetical protein